MLFGSQRVAVLEGIAEKARQQCRLGYRFAGI